MIDFLIFLGKAIAAVFVLYLAVRVAATAYFKSKQHYEREKRNEP